jgi:phosphatidylglycerophosphate synthase
MIIVYPGETGLRSALTEIRECLARGERCVIKAHDVLTADLALAPVLDDPHCGTALLVRPSAHGGNARVRHHIVMAIQVGPYLLDSTDHELIGAMSISADHATEVVNALDEFEGLLNGNQLPNLEDSFAAVALVVVRSGAPVRAMPFVNVPWCRADAERADVEAALMGLSNERIQRLQANRVDDGFYSTFVVRKVAKPLTRAALALGLSPNSVTVVSFVVGIAAAVMFAQGSWAWILAGAIALQLSLVIDCVDGEVARSTRNFTALGAWLDASTDRVKEMLVYAGLAIASQSWHLAVALILVQTVRHMSDYNFAAAQRRREAVVLPRSLADHTDIDSVSSLSVVSARMNRRPLVHWVKKVIHMPIGERWLLISVVAVIAGPSAALLVLLIAVLFALTYVTVGRVVRTLSWHGDATADIGILLSRQSDVGPVLFIPMRAIRWRGPWGWAYPALLRTLELGIMTLIALWWAPSVIVLVFWWMAIVAFHDYDLLYRALHNRAMPRWLIWLGLGWDGRLIVVMLALSFTVLATVLGVGIVWLAIVLVVVASAQWLRTTVRSR